MTEYKMKTGKVGEKVVGAYQKVEDTVVSAYKTIENGAVSGYKKIEKRFVDAFLTEADGEEEQ